MTPPAPEPHPHPEQIVPPCVVHEDDDLLVVNKPPGWNTHAPAVYAGEGIYDWLKHREPRWSRLAIVHRLDKDTSGLLVVAKTDRAHKALAAQFADHGRSGPLERAYLALAWGAPSPARGEIEAPIGRDPKSRVKMAVRAGGRRALTRYAVVETYRGKGGKPVASLVECRLATGRTHQIRLHLAKLGHPVLGDAVYGSGFRSKETALSPAAREALSALGRQALHAYRLGFAHPLSGKALRFDSKLPPKLARLTKALKTL